MNVRESSQRWSLRVAIISILFTTVYLGNAQAQSVQNQPSPERTDQVARELAQLILPETVWNQTVYSMLQQMMLAKSGKDPEKIFKLIFPELNEALPYEFVIQTNIAIWIKYFSDEELRELLAFYRTKTGQKLVKTQPQVIADSMAVVMHRMQTELPAIVERIKKRRKTAK